MIKLIVPRVVAGKIIDVTAEYSEGAWQCGNTAFLEVLNVFTVPAGYHPDPDLALVRSVAERYRGKVEDLRPPRQLTDEVY